MVKKINLSSVFSNAVDAPYFALPVVQQKESAKKKCCKKFKDGKRCKSCPGRKN